MRALLPQPEQESKLPQVGEVPDPTPASGEALLGVRASGLNHADLLQLGGHYPPPPGEPEVPGLECSGEIVELGSDASGEWKIGDRVMALTGGGAHAELVAVPTGQLMRLPEEWSFEQGAALPESALTAWTNLVAEGELAEGEWVIISGATGAVGSFACQLASELGAEVIALGRDVFRLEELAQLGIRHTLRESHRLPQEVHELMGGASGADLLIELVGGEGFASRLECLGRGGRAVVVGLLAGGRTSLDLGRVLRSRLRIIGSTLRSRPRQEKAELTRDFENFADPRMADGQLRPPRFTSFPVEELLRAWQHYARKSGKVVLTW